jgi:hypothetical protein
MIDFTFSKESIEKWKEDLKPDHFWELIFTHLKIKRKGDFTWQLAVDHAPPQVLEELNVHRRKFWAGLSAILRSYCAPFCAFNESGTIAPTSDIDVTMIYSKALNLLKFIHRIIHKLYGKNLTMENLFDMNIYVHTWYMLCDSNRTGPLIIEDCSSRNKMLDEATLDRQHTWSLLRVYQARNAFKDIWNLVPEVKQNEVAMLHEDLMKWKRRKDPLFKAIEVMEEYQNTMTQEVYDATSRVAYLEQEAFYSLGAYLHVVVRLQQQRYIKLLPMHYKMSFCDNMGFLLFALEKAPNSGKIMKYLYRCLDAIRQLTNINKYNAEYQLLSDYQRAKTAGDLVKKNAIMEKWIQRKVDIMSMIKNVMAYAM